ncbi:MAG: rhomboid family intramembrane serine protease [Flavobacteriales bacterium]|nr:rhomboid family intramembrane serine protease [Flavobacteriales bacterium]
MSNPLFNELKNQYKNGSSLIKLIFVNVGIFVLLSLLRLTFYFFNDNEIFKQLILWLSLPADIFSLVRKPWTLISYMFLHEELFHLLFNMLVLYFAGQIFLYYLSSKKLVSTYLLGGLVGGSLYVLLFNVLPVFNGLSSTAYALGASASVMAILITAATYVPNFTVRLIVFGEVKLKYIAMVYVIIDIVSIPKGNAGGHIAHLGGALFGFLYAKQLLKGKDFTLGFSNILEKLVNTAIRKRSMSVVYKKPKSRNDYDYNAQKQANQQKIDSILDKISKSGYDSLSAEEKSILFDAGKK